MDRAGRIVVSWIVGCMIPGVGLIAANLAVGNQPMTDQNVVWIRLGMFLIGLGLVAVLVEIVLVLDGHRHGPQSTEALTAGPPSRAGTAPNEELEAARKRLGELETNQARADADLRRKRLEGVRERLAELIEWNSREDAAGRGPDQKTEAYSQIDAMDRAVREIIPDQPDEIERYDRQPDNVVWSGLPWHEHVITMLKIRRDRISELINRLPR